MTAIKVTNIRLIKHISWSAGDMVVVYGKSGSSSGTFSSCSSDPGSCYEETEAGGAQVSSTPAKSAKVWRVNDRPAMTHRDQPNVRN
jgi:hypothetical protein